MKVIIDRFENNYAIAELNNGENFIDIPKNLIPPNTKEGDVLNIITDSSGNIIGAGIDTKETQSRESHIKNLMSQIFDDKRQK